LRGPSEEREEESEPRRRSRRREEKLRRGLRLEGCYETDRLTGEILRRGKKLRERGARRELTR